MQQPRRQMPRETRQFTDYQKKILALEPKREDHPNADDEEWKEIKDGFRHRTAHILRPQAPRSTGSPK